MSSYELSRRSFLRQACGAVGTIGLSSTVWNLRAIAAAVNAAPVHRPSSITSAGGVADGDFKALVCLFLYGGNDSNNVLVPYDATNYAMYANARGGLALSQGSLLPITPATSDGRNYALHPSLVELRNLFASGQAAVMANVGTLVAPVTRASYLNRTVALPPQLFSHADQQTQWQTSWPDSPQGSGWGGRMADLLSSLNGSAKVSMNISLAGTNTFEVGNVVSAYQISPGGAPGLSGFNGTTDPNYLAYNNIINLPYTNLFERAFAQTTRGAIDNSAIISAALAAAPALTTVFPSNSYLASQLHMVAQMIGIRSALGMRRQIYFVAAGGFDTHGDQLVAHSGLLQDLSRSMGAFYNATVELGVAKQVTTFTASDFGRTLVTNGSGSDHGWGSHHFVMGGDVRGGDLYGKFPTLTVNGSDDTDDGRWIPSTSVDQYAATLAKWFGVADSAMPTVFPNLSRFGGTGSYLGFMN